MKDNTNETHSGQETTSVTTTEGGSWRRNPYREHQAKAIEAAARHYGQNDRGQLIVPCGCGKTATAQGIREALGARATLVLVPSLALVKQFKNEWAKWVTMPYDEMCVASDVPPDEEDAVRVSTSELGTLVSTAPAEIARFLKRPEPKVVFSTYQSLKAVCEAAKEAGVPFDLAVCDEAHRTAGDDLNLFAEIHHDRSLAVRKRLYMTATPCVSPPMYGTPSGLDYLRNMDNPRAYGRPFFQMTFKEAIDGGLLADYRIVAIGLTDEVIAKSDEAHKRSWTIASVEDVAMNYALDLMMREHGVRKVVTFHRRVKDAAEFAERHLRLFPEVGVWHVNGQMKSVDRDSALGRFAAAGSAVVTNAQCLREGVDVPAIDAVMFCDRKQSTIDIVQAVGRALRVDRSRPGKLANVIVPVFHRREELLDLALDERDLQQVVNVVRAMSDEDEVLKGAVTVAACKAVSAARRNGDSTSCKLEVVGFDPCYPKKLFVQIVQKAASGWDVQYQHLAEFRRRHPDRWPAQAEEFPEGNRLGGWCSNQRQARRTHRLSGDRAELLDRIGFPWEFGDRWMVQYEHLKDYRKAHPDRWPTQAEESPEGNKLGGWCGNQRQLRRTHRLSADRVELLDRIGFPWGKQQPR